MPLLRVQSLLPFQSSLSLPPLHHPSTSPTTRRIRASSSTPPPSDSRAIIIGAGLSGLAAAHRLHSSNIPFLLLEASDAVGGRVRTDSHRGFLLDRGFQIFLTAYPEARALLDYPSLDLRQFYPGALVYFDGSFHRVSDPFRRPLHGILSLLNPIGSIPDKLRIGLARFRSIALPDSVLLSAPELPIFDRLIRDGFSPSVIDRFFRPFFGGIFFDRNLCTTSRLFDFVFKCLALGENTLPANGIAAIPEQLAARLPTGTIRLNSRVESINPDGNVVLSGEGEVVRGGRGVIVAVEGPEAGRLIPGLVKNRGKESSTVCLYFSAERAPIEEPILFLNGTGKGLVNNMFFATNVAGTYGPEGKVLVSVTVVGEQEGTSDDDLMVKVVRELAGWFGEGVVGEWEHLRTYRIGYAQPNQSPPTEVAGREPRVGDGMYVCGDHWSSSTFDGALVSGRRAAEALLKDRGLL